MVCSSRDNNPDTVNLMFQSTRMALYVRTTANHRHQGYTGLLHGGMTSTLLDAAMTHCLFMQGVQALTAELTVRFISPVCTGDKLMVCARLLGQRRGIYLLEAWLTKGQTVARATAKFIVPSQDIALAHR
jgi:uncharacterized protein (TIGR00369 family)